MISSIVATKTKQEKNHFDETEMKLSSIKNEINMRHFNNNSENIISNNGESEAE